MIFVIIEKESDTPIAIDAHGQAEPMDCDCHEIIEYTVDDIGHGAFIHAARYRWKLQEYLIANVVGASIMHRLDNEPSLVH